MLLGGLCAAVPQIAAAQTVYVTNETAATVTPIDTATNTPRPAIKVDAAPRGIAVTPDGRTAFVANGAGTLTPIDTATGAPGAPIPTGSAAYAIAISPDGRTAYAVTANGIVPVDLATRTPGPPIEAGVGPQAIGITPDGSRAYVVDYGGTVTPFSTITNVVGAPIKVGSEPNSIAITPDGRTAYVANQSSNSVTPIDTATNTAGAPIKVGMRPYAITITPNGATVYVADDNSQSVTPISTATNTAGPAIKLGECPDAISAAPNGKTVYVADACKDNVTPIDTATNTVGATIPVGKNPEGMTVTPDQPPLAALAGSAATLGQPTGFSASASTDQDGLIASYFWDFGDGTALSTTVPSTSHTYGATGTYTARLTLTDDDGCSTTFLFSGQTSLCDGSSSASATTHVVVAPAPIPAPLITSLTQAHVRWRAGSRLARASAKRKVPVGTTFAFTLNETASVKLAFAARRAGRRVKGRCVAPSRNNRHRPPCERTVGRGSLAFTGHAGANRISFQGRISPSKTLAPGRYTVVIVATAADGRHSASSRLSFTIVR